jgi:hypothetical protein
MTLSKRNDGAPKRLSGADQTVRRLPQVILSKHPRRRKRQQAAGNAGKASDMHDQAPCSPGGRSTDCL